MIEERVAWAAKLLDLTPYLDRRPKELSGGQRQRVAMGRAIVRQPQVFLMDEPLSNLDAKLRVQMRADIAQLQSELGTTTIYVTHDQVEAMTMGDRVAVMSKGLLQQIDVPQRLYDKPGEPLRRRLHRHAADEPARGDGVGERRRVRRYRRQLDRRRRRGARELPGPEAHHGGKVIVGLRAGDLHPAQGRDDLPQIHARRPARRVARRRVDGVLQGGRARPIRARPRATRSERGRARAPRRGRVAAEPCRVVPAARASEGWATTSRRGRREEPPLLRRNDRVLRFASASCRGRAARVSLAAGAGGRHRTAVCGRRRRRSPRRRAPRALASERIYFVMTDRYANGDPPTTRGGDGQPRQTGSTRPTRGYLHGGDFKGLTGTAPTRCTASSGSRISASTRSG